MLKQEIENRSQMEFFCIDEFVPKKHLLRKIDKAVDFEHIYEMVFYHFYAVLYSAG